MVSVKSLKEKNMKVTLLFLMLGCLNHTYAFEVNEKGSGVYQNEERLKPMSKAVRAFVLNRLEYKQTKMKSLSDMTKELKNKNDQEVLNKLMTSTGDLKLVQGKFKDDQYVVDLGKFKIKIETTGFVTGELMINDRKLNINDYNTLESFLTAVEKIGNEELDKTASILPVMFDLFIPSAEAATKGGKYIDILKVNSAGVIYLSLNKMAVWRNDADDFRKLLSQVEKDVDSAIGQCESQAATVGVSGDAVRIYGVLNDTTRKTLQSIVDKSSGEITEERVLAGLFTKYAAKENHGEKAPKNVSCMSFLGPFGRENIDFKMSIETTICPQVQKLTECLGNLYSSDKRVSNIARNEPLKKWSGDRFESDTNYLDQISTIAK
jgi:hypothetical protein